MVTANPFVVAIDGPAGAGKSTVARALAARLGCFLLDTGALYRAVALAASEASVPWSDGARLAEVAGALPLAFDEHGRLFIGANDVSAAIRTPELSQGASTVSAHPEVRAALLEVQRRIARNGSCVVEGRDIGTVVLPWAQLKIFLTAKPEVRARRRQDELVARGIHVDFAETLREMNERDERDSTRKTAPLRQAHDAVLVDSSTMSFDEVVAHLESLANTRR